MMLYKCYFELNAVTWVAIELLVDVIADVLQKSIPDWKCLYSNKKWNKLKQNVHGCNNIYCLHLELLLTKYLGTLLNNNLISNCCQFISAFLLTKPEY